MGLFTALVEAAALGAQAKAQQLARKQASKTAAKNDVDCTPCAANARVMAYREAAQAGLPRRGRR